MRFFKRNRSLSDIEKQLLEASKGDDHTKHEEEISEQDHFAKSTNFLGRMIGKLLLRKILRNLMFGYCVNKTTATSPNT